MSRDHHGHTLERWREETEREQSATARSSLLPWQLSLAEWIANQDYNPKVVAMAAKASEMATAALGSPVDVSPDDIRSLRQRPAFKKMVRRMRDEALARAREKITTRLSMYVDMHAEAARIAQDKKDYKAMANIASPILDRVWPVREQAQTNTQINITLAPKQQQALDTSTTDDVEILEAEIVSVEPDLDG